MLYIFNQGGKDIMNIKSILIACCSIVFLAGCVSQSQYDNAQHAITTLQQQIDSLKSVCDKYQSTILSLRDSVNILSFPADQRFAKASQLVESGNFDAAREEIGLLKVLFPDSQEAVKCATLLASIEKKEAQAKAEAERLKALGFKAFTDNSTVRVGDVTYSFSGFSFGRTYTFDYCNDVGEYSYYTADKNNTYILSTVAVSTKSNYASAPSLKACKIVDGKLKSLGYFRSEYASWTSYGAKIGNYSDDSHDFSKVNTVRYKLGNEISVEDSKNPIVIVIAKAGKKFTEDSDIEYTKENYTVVKIINRNKL